MDYHAIQSVLKLFESHLLLVRYGLIVFDLLIVDLLKPFKLDHQHWRVLLDFKLLKGQSHVLALTAPPGIFLIQLLRLRKLLQALLEGGVFLEIWRHRLFFDLDVWHEYDL